jgi:pyruvate-ferredoxin/flavodoxin oxidoreductase
VIESTPPAASETWRTLDANEAVADVAYRLNEVVAIYPITPASPMGEHADAWSADGRSNLWGSVPQVVQMQSEGGAAGAVHGALQAGALVTTFTASQGLLLMLPDMFKIAGELTAFCMHVAARSVATHALSIFGDHSDVMAVRGTGFALLASGSAQEAQDLAAIGHAATLAARVPVLHFFDGFRTSHEITKVRPLDDDTLHALMPADGLRAHRARALDSEHPVLRGSSQNPDTFFQCREAAEPFHAAFPDVLDDTMQRFAVLTSRRYRLFDYIGHPQVERVLVLMGSGAECAHETVEHLMAQGEQVGVIKVRLFRPFAVDRLLQVLPASVVSLAVLDRTKEPGSSGEPLLQEFATALAMAVAQGQLARMPRLSGGRYGLGGKEFTPAMVKAVFDALAQDTAPARFTVGIRDDVSATSLHWDVDFDRTFEPTDTTRAVFFGLGADGTVSANKASIKIIGEKTALFAQGHFEYDSRKAGATTVSHLRFGPQPIRSTWRIQQAQFVAVHASEFLERRDLFDCAAPGATVLLNAPIPASKVWDSLPREAQQQLVERRCRVYAIDGSAQAERAGLGRHISTVMQLCFFSLSGVLPVDQAMTYLRESFEQTWGRRGPEVLRRNLAALEGTLAALEEVPVPLTVTSTRGRRPLVPADAPDFAQRVTKLLLEGRGDELPVSAFPSDGTWPTGTSRLEKSAIALDIPIWQVDLCVQCNRCVTICPHTAIRAKVFEPNQLASAPEGFRWLPEAFEPNFEGLHYTVQVAPEDCTGCGLCIEVCPAKDRHDPRRRALVAEPLPDHREQERVFFDFFEHIESAPLAALPIDQRMSAFRTPLFEFSGACAGCGETPYLSLLTRLFGDRLLIANATGCSSIYGGNLPTTPYAKNAQGRGPAWSNSLFEDNAEFGLGLRLALDAARARALSRLQAVATRLPIALRDGLLESQDDEAWIMVQRARVAALEAWLLADGSPEALALHEDCSALLPRSVWIVGGDGWAYDIGYGGLDHVLSGQRKVNVLVLDTEVYSNTGGQQSKATPLGASAKFAIAGKATRKKDLGLLAMAYGHVYVAQVGMQSHPEQTVRAMLEAERHPGPSLVIAHSPCIAHGYDLVHSPTQQKRAIDSGAWPLYRFDPARITLGDAPLVLDSGEPTLDLADYMAGEARFRMVELRSPARYRELLAAGREAATQVRALYEQLSHVHLPKPQTPPETSHG